MTTLYELDETLQSNPDPVSMSRYSDKVLLIYNSAAL